MSLSVSQFSSLVIPKVHLDHPSGRGGICPILKSSRCNGCLRFDHPKAGKQYGRGYDAQPWSRVQGKKRHGWRWMWLVLCVDQSPSLYILSTQLFSLLFSNPVGSVSSLVSFHWFCSIGNAMPTHDCPWQTHGCEKTTNFNKRNSRPGNNICPLSMSLGRFSTLPKSERERPNSHLEDPGSNWCSIRAKQARN